MLLIVARGLMGVGGAFIFPTTLSILTNTFDDPVQRGRAIGVWAGVSAIGIALGPLAGGFLIEHFGWQAVFLVNVPICATTFVLARIFIPPSVRRDESPLDPLGAALSILALVPLLYAIIEAPDHGWLAPRTVTGFALATVFFDGHPPGGEGLARGNELLHGHERVDQTHRRVGRKALGLEAGHDLAQRRFHRLQTH